MFDEDTRKLLYQRYNSLKQNADPDNFLFESFEQFLQMIWDKAPDDYSPHIYRMRFIGKIYHPDTVKFKRRKDKLHTTQATQTKTEETTKPSPVQIVELARRMQIGYASLDDLLDNAFIEV